MKKKTLLSVLLLALLACLFTACNAEGTPTGTKVTFNLEGGTYGLSQQAVEYYYNFAEGAKRLVKPLGSFGSTRLERSGYDFVGWYKTKNDDGTYTDAWNFDKDEIAEDGSTQLYASWEKQKFYSYRLLYRNGAGEDVELGSYPVSENGIFNGTAGAAINYANENNLTLVDYTTGSPDGESRGYEGLSGTRPSGETLVVDVYCHFIEGRYTLVSTADAFKTAFASNKKMYLTTDIDLSGKSFVVRQSINNLEIRGNGHTVSNLTVAVGNQLGYLSKDNLKDDINDDGGRAFYVTMSAEMKNCNISDLTFANVSFVGTANSETGEIYGGEGDLQQYNIYLAALCGKASGCTFSNVTIGASADFGGGIDQSKIICAEANNLYLLADGTTTATDCAGTVVYQKGE